MSTRVEGVIADSRSVGCGERLGIAGNTLGGGGKSACVHGWGQKWVCFRLGGRIFDLCRVFFDLPGGGQDRRVCMVGDRSGCFFDLGGVFLALVA